MKKIVFSYGLLIGVLLCTNLIYLPFLADNCENQLVSGYGGILICLP